MKAKRSLPLPLRLNLFIAFIALVSALGTAALLTYHTLDQHYRNMWERSRTIATLIAENTRSLLDAGDRAAIKRMLEKVGEMPEIAYVTIEDARCQPWISKGDPTAAAPAPHPCPPYSDETHPLWYWIRHPEIATLTQVAIMQDDSGKADSPAISGYVRVGLDLHGLRHMFLDALVWALLITTILLVPILLFSWRRSRRLTRPLGHLHRALEQLTRKRAIPVPISAPIPEIRALEEKFNTVLQWLNEYQNHFQSYQKQLEALAFQDTLTGLTNRAWLQANLDRTIQESRRQNSSLALLFLDLDRFKIINDTLGHKVGDQLLRMVSGILRETVRTSDHVIRHGGDEFLILLTQLGSTREEASSRAGTVAEKIITQLNQPLMVDDHELSTSFSIGIALFPHDAGDADTLLRYADTAMYAAKEAGRNTFRLFQPQQSQEGRRRLSLEASLHHAVNKQQLAFHLQPQIHYPDREITGVEVLLRWHHEEEWIPPEEFIPMLEETGLIVPVGEWLIWEILELQRRWHRKRLCGEQFRYVAVNVSPVQLWRADFTDRILAILNAYRGDEAPFHLQMELTESSLVQPTPAILETFHRLRVAGVHFVLDDFGTGYSNLSCLKRFPLNVIKIDKTFIRGCTTEPADGALVVAITAMARGLGLRVIAEGVETEAQADFLNRHGCRTLQGNLFARPMTVTRFEEFLTAHRTQNDVGLETG